jgi:hypothetical protein
VSLNFVPRTSHPELIGNYTSVRQYKYHFKKWQIAKSIPSAVKNKAIQTLGKRVRDGTEFGGIRYKGVEIDKKRLRRYINDDVRLNADFKLIASV